MKLFILSLEDDAMEWFQDQSDNKFKTVKEIIEAFNDRWGDRSDNHFLLAALHTSQKQESETMEEFNKRFNDLVKSLPADIKPREASLLIYYIQALEGEMNYQIRNKEPVNLKDAQEKAIKIEKNMQDLGKSNVLGFSMDSPLESHKVKKVENQEPQGDSIDKLTQLIKQMEVNHANQIAAMQANQTAWHNKLVAMERESNNHNPNDRWQKDIPKGPPYPEQERPPEPMEANNWFDDSIIPYCRACDDINEEGTCPIFFQIIKEKLAVREKVEQVNMVGHECVFDNNEDLLDSVEDSKDMVCMTRNMDKVEETCDHNLTPKFNEFSSDDLGGWTDDIEFPFPITEIVDVPAQEDKPPKALESLPPVSKVLVQFQFVLASKSVKVGQNESVVFQDTNNVHSVKDQFVSFLEFVKDRISNKEVNRVRHKPLCGSVDFWKIFKDVRHYQSHKKQERVKRATNQVFLQKDKYLVS